MRKQYVQGPVGSYFLATSHSANRKGHDKAKRRRLYQLKLEGRALKIVGSLDLASAIAESRVLDGRPVDIEALAFHEGELFIGLGISPQNAAGAAYILRVREVLSALQEGVLPSGRIQIFAELPLSVDAAAGKVIQGVSDMSFLPDGSLAILANSPKKMPPDGGGALWLRKRDGKIQLLRRFPGLKPEGVTPTQDGKSLVIVFDNDRKQPLWIHQPLPAVTVQLRPSNIPEKPFRSVRSICCEMAEGTQPESDYGTKSLLRTGMISPPWRVDTTPEIDR